MSSLKEKSTNAAIWSAADKFGEQGVKFITGIIVARLLFPSDYGLIGMLAIFLAIPDVLINSGFGAALIQKKSVDDTDYSTVFYFNIFTSVLLYGVLYLSAPFIASFFNEPQLVSLARVLGLIFITTSFGIVQRTILTKRLDFKTQTKITIISIIPSGILGILLAFYGYGVWAIVIQSLTRQFLTTLLFWLFNTWRPKLIFSIQSLKSLFAFGSNLLIAGLLNTVFLKLNTIVIGKVFNAESLGFYSRADQLRSLPVNSLISIIERIAFPIFSTLQNDNKLFLRGYRKTVKMASFINFPLMLGLIVVSEPFVRLLLTEKWLPLVPYLQLMCITGLSLPIQSLTMSVITAKGDSGLFLKLDIVKKVLLVITLFITYRWGVIAIVLGNTILSYFFFYLNFYFAGKKMDFSFRNQLLDLLPYTVIGLTMAVFMYVSGLLISDSDILKLMVQAITGIVVYVGLSKLFKLEAYKETMTILVRIKSKFRK